MRALVSLSFLLASVGSTGAADEKLDPGHLLGTWEWTKGKDDKLPFFDFEKMVLEFTGHGRVTVRLVTVDNTEPYDGTFKIDGNKLHVVWRLPKIFRDDKDTDFKYTVTILKLTELDFVGTDFMLVEGKVAALKNLTTLRLRSVKVTDAGLKELAPLNNLKVLDLSGTQVTEAGVEELQKALPKCKITK